MGYYCWNINQYTISLHASFLGYLPKNGKLLTYKNKSIDFNIYDSIEDTYINIKIPFLEIFDVEKIKVKYKPKIYDFYDKIYNWFIDQFIKNKVPIVFFVAKTLYNEQDSINQYIDLYLCSDINLYKKSPILKTKPCEYSYDMIDGGYDQFHDILKYYKILFDEKRINYEKFDFNKWK